ncbi:hypothetical protein [uncultured Methylobacterium sp.]|uniref:hypothetical protein n=1 Tax=uncultured Methylobacterium sp. TaxID=157278 RepID=UPI0035CBBA83
MMRHALFGLMLATVLARPGPASAASDTMVGVGSGAVAGALVAGPVGAVAGAVIGGVVASSTARARRARPRPAPMVRQRLAQAPARRAVRHRAEATPPADRPRAGGGTATSWKDPR